MGYPTVVVWMQSQHGCLAMLGCSTDSLGRGCPEWQEADPVLCLSSPLTPLAPSLVTPLLTEEPLTHYGSSHSRPLPKVRLHYTLERERRRRKKLQTSYAVACCLFCRSEAIMAVIKWKTITWADKTFFEPWDTLSWHFSKLKYNAMGWGHKGKRVGWFRDIFIRSIRSQESTFHLEVNGV